MTSFAEWLQRVRLARPGWSQERLANTARQIDPRSRLSQTRLSEYERRVCLPNLRQLLVIGRVLELTDAEILEGRMLWEAGQLHETSSGGIGDTPTPV